VPESATPHLTTSAAAAGLHFKAPGALPVEACFDGGRLTSDGGLVWLGEANAVLAPGGICGALAAVLPEWRTRARSVRHSLETLVLQRVLQIACGYEDQNDADTLRTDPLLKLLCGQRPETGRDLASQPTLSRLENAVRVTTCYRLALAVGAVYLRERERLARTSGAHRAPGGIPRRILLDFDGTDDPTHGHQEGSAYHGYYGQHQYFPLLVFDGDTGQLVTAVLRPGNVHGSHGVVAVLKRIVRALRTQWPGVRIEVRADSGFAVPALYDYCDAERIAYTIGLIPNPRLERSAAPLLAEAQRRQAEQGGKVRLAGSTTYQADSWSRPRRVVYKAEALAEGPNTRFVVTTSTAPPLAVYDRYVDRGAPELWIKDFKRACKGDRLSDHRFVANQFRLFLHAAAYWLLDTLRAWLAAAGVERLQLDTLRLRLLKVGGRVREWLTRVRLHLAASHPAEPLWRLLATRPHRLVNNPG
jgi:hypothetical protein